MRIACLFIFLLFQTVAHSQDSKNVKLLCNWNDTAHVRKNNGGNRYSDVWGFTHKGKEYAAVGSTEGVHIIDVNNCKQVCWYPGAATGGNIVHRDYKTFSHYLYAVCDEDTSTLQIFDLNYLPDSLHLVYNSDKSQIMLVHNIFIDTAKATLYLATARTFFSADGMRVYSLVNPEKPALIDIYNNIAPVHDVYVRNDTAFCSSSTYGYEVVDFSQHGTHKTIGGLLFYPYQGYNHSSWIGKNGIGVMADESRALPLKVIDARNVAKMEVLSTFTPHVNDSNCIPHNPYILDDFVYISHYGDGLQIYDLRDPKHPVQAGYYDTYPFPTFGGFNGAWGCYPYLPSRKVLISDMSFGLFVFDVSEATRVGNPDIVPAAFELYPNPTGDKLSFSFPPPVTDEQLGVAITDVSGKCIFRETFKTSDHSNGLIELNLPANSPKGMYFLRVVLQEKQYKAKFIKQ